jgi:ATP-dependent DNA helicase HFM1/MER3
MVDGAFLTTSSSAPTASGKTVCFELAIVRSLIEQISSIVIYLAPIKALCHERYSDWSQKFPQLKCFELTGDSDFVPQQQLLKTNIMYVPFIP